MFKKLLKKFKPTKINIVLIVVLAFLLVLLIFNLAFTGRIFPGISVSGIKVGGLRVEQAANLLSEKSLPLDKVTLVGQGQTFDIWRKDVELNYSFTKSAENAYQLTRSGNIVSDLGTKIVLLFKPKSLGLSLNLNEEKLKNSLLVIADQLSTEPIYPEVKLVNQKIEIEKGKEGVSPDTLSLRALIGKSFSLLESSSITIPFNSVGYSLTPDEVIILQSRAEKLLGKEVVLKFQEETFVTNEKTLLGFLNIRSEYDEGKIAQYIEGVSQSINRQPQDSVFIFDAGKVKEFTPSKDGYTVKEDSLKQMLIGNVRTLETSDEVSVSLEIPVDVTAPKVKMDDVNNLGINELIGKGTSKFAHSIANRVYNIGLASSKFKGVLVAPDEILSINDILGDVSQLTGYKQAFVIQEGKTVLGDGGGVCQVSTTLFRAALNAGLPIIERKAHSYRVGYYEQDSPPGIDATVFAPSADLKIKNDTSAHILIQPIFDAKKMTLEFDIYGTADGRKVTLTKPVVTNITPAPDDLYIDDPTLPLGEIKQIDFRAAGATVKFSYKVETEGKVTFEKIFVSNYHPWQAVYLRGIKTGQ